MSDDLSPDIQAAFGLWQHDGLHPLTTIVGYTRLLKEERFGPLTENQAQAIATIQTHTQRAIEVWYRSAAYFHANYSPHEPAAILLSELFEEVHHRVGLYGITLASNMPDSLISIIGQQSLLAIALGYLVYPLDQLSYCTNADVWLSIALLTDQTVRIIIASALQLPRDTDDHMRGWWYPGGCLNTAAVIMQRHGSTITMAQTETGIRFSVDLPILTV